MIKYTLSMCVCVCVCVCFIILKCSPSLMK